MSIRPTIVFDLDGTLVDTAPDLIGALNAILTREGLAALPLEQARNMVGQGVRVLLDRGLAAERVRVSPLRFEQLYADFLTLYESRIAAESRPFPGAAEALQWLARHGWTLAVCTNKLENLSRKLLGELGLLDRFAAVCGGDTFPVRKPDPQALLGTLARTGGDPRLAIMVGDSKTDLDTARNASVPVVGVTFGYTDVPMASLGPDRLISHFEDLPEAVDLLVGARV